MYLDAVRTVENGSSIGAALPLPIVANRTADAVYARWNDWQPSEISHHGTACCEIAKEWLIAKDTSELGGQSAFTGPRWLKKYYKWGASSFPIFWCEAVGKKTLDCGAFAAFAYEIFRARGVLCYRVQMVQRFSELSAAQWVGSWTDGATSLPWIHDDLIYHEGCAIHVGSDFKIWDASAGWWTAEFSLPGYGSLLAAKISGQDLGPGIPFNWGKSVLRSAEWVSLK